KCVALSAAATRHGRQKDDGRAGAYFGVEPVQRANVLALHVDVHERRELAALHELAAQRGEAAHEVVEQLAHGVALRRERARTVDLLAQRGWDADVRHARSRVPEQNST